MEYLSDYFTFFCFEIFFRTLKSEKYFCGDFTEDTVRSPRDGI